MDYNNSSREELLRIIRKHNKDTTVSNLKIKNYTKGTKSRLVKTCEVIDGGDDKIKDWNENAKLCTADTDVVISVTKNRKSINEPISKNIPEKQFAKISLNMHSLVFVNEKPNKYVLTVNRKENEICEICCVAKKSQQMMPCYNCIYPCCSECFLKRVYLTLKKGDLNGRCFGCRAELLLLKKIEDEWTLV
jgi:hypothetical protein